MIIRNILLVFLSKFYISILIKLYLMSICMTENKPIKFIKEVARYFMDFLESDFHKKNAPKRVISFKNDKNYLIGIDLKKYEKFSNTV